MNRIFAFDQLVKVIVSYFFRIIFILYAATIYFYFSSYFSDWIYACTTITYSITSYILLTKAKQWPKIRLFADYIFASIFLYGKDVHNLHCIVFLLLPIFNIPNFSGHKKSFLLLFLTAAGSYV